MLLQQIVSLFDQELERLGNLRGIVAGLAGPSVLELSATSPVSDVPESTPGGDGVPDPATTKRRQTRSLAGQRRGRPVKKTRVPEASALGGVIPSAPVVVTAEALARRAAAEVHLKRKPSAPVPEPGSLGSMIRALRLPSES